MSSKPSSHISRLRRYMSRVVRSSRIWKSGLILAFALWLIVGEALPAVADGPLIPGYTLRDGEPVPAPTGYIQSGVIGGENQPCGPFIGPQDLFLDPDTGNLLLVDTGNNRIVVLSGDGEYLYEIGGQEADLNAPEGVYVDVEGNVWVADTGNARVVQFTPDGAFLADFHRPESDFMEGFDFQPAKIVIDKRGFIYTVIGSEGNLGILVMDSTERFRGFFGRTKVSFNLTRVLARIFATKAQRRRMLRVRPAPMSNIHIDDLGFIYAVSPVLTKDQIQRLNSVGENVYGEGGTRVGAGKLWDKIRGKEGLTFGEAEIKWRWDGVREMSIPYEVGSLFVDVAVDDLGIVSALDQQRYLIYQYDQAGNLLSIFGGQGMREGAFSQPVSIVAGSGGLLYILDATRGQVLIFRPTEITSKIHTASSLYFEGKYDEAARLWNEISRLNTNFGLAHSGLGKALMQQEDYEVAMQEYFYAENKYGYSAAFSEYRYVWLRRNFNWLGFVVLGSLVSTAVAANRLSDSFRWLLAKIRHLRETSGLRAVPVLLLLAVLVRMGSLAMQSYHFQAQRPEETRLLFEAGKILIPWITWCVAVVAVGEIFYGEGTFRQILAASAWALWPYIVLTLPLNVLTNVITLDEKVIYNAGEYFTWALLVWELLRVIRTTHQFDMGKAMGVMLLTLFTMLLIWVLSGLVYALTGEIVRFVQQLALEIYVRQY